MLGKLAKNADSGVIPKEHDSKSGAGPGNMHFSKHARWFCCGCLGTPFEKQGTSGWHKPVYLGGTHLLSEHSLGSYTMPGVVPGAVRAARVPEQQAPPWQASEEADEMGCRDPGDGGLGSGCPRMLLREAPAGGRPEHLGIFFIFQTNSLVPSSNQPHSGWRPNLQTQNSCSREAPTCWTSTSTRRHKHSSLFLSSHLPLPSVPPQTKATA